MLAALVALAATPAQAALRCGTRLITEGDRKIEVLARCGEPALIEERVAYHTLRRTRSKRFSRRDMLGVEREVLVAVDLEEWTYNFGPRRLMRLVRFANGKVIDIVSLDYGY